MKQTKKFRVWFEVEVTNDEELFTQATNVLANAGVGPLRRSRMFLEENRDLNRGACLHAIYDFKATDVSGLTVGNVNIIHEPEERDQT